jgi:hypothetical protein
LSNDFISYKGYPIIKSIYDTLGCNLISIDAEELDSHKFHSYFDSKLFVKVTDDSSILTTQIPAKNTEPSSSSPSSYYKFIYGDINDKSVLARGFEAFTNSNPIRHYVNFIFLIAKKINKRICHHKRSDRSIYYCKRGLDFNVDNMKTLIKFLTEMQNSNPDPSLNANAHVPSSSSKPILIYFTSEAHNEEIVEVEKILNVQKDFFCSTFLIRSINKRRHLLFVLVAHFICRT